MASNVLRIPRSDAKGSFVLARMVSTGPASRPLTGRVVATEGMAPYVLALRHDKIDRLRADKSPCSPDEWERILVFLLLGQGAVANIEATAVVQEEKELTIAIQRRVESITQRLGTLFLVHDEDEAIELFDWCGEAVEGRAAAQEGLVHATAKEAELEKLVAELKGQLDEFMAVKAEEEKVLLENFCTLLNEKKVKIRVQQRALEALAGQGSSQVKIKAEDEGEDEPMQDARAEIKEEEDSPPASATMHRTSRATSRKVGAIGLTQVAARRGAKRPAAASDEEESSSDDGFEQTAPRGAGKGASRKDRHGRSGENSNDDDEGDDDNDNDGEEDEEEAQTTDEDESTQGEGEEEDEEENEPEKAAPPARRKWPAAEGKGRASNKAKGKGAAQSAREAAAPEAVEAPPPRRELVFGRAKQGLGSAQGSSSNSHSHSRKAAKAEESETDSDDEL